MSTNSNTASKCMYCGNNPVNHTMEYISESASVYTLPLSRAIDFCVRPFFFNIVHTLGSGFIELFRVLGLLYFSDDSTKACSQRSAVIWQEATKRGIKMQQMIVSKKPAEQYRAYINNRWCHFSSIPLPFSANKRAYIWMDSKAEVKKLLLQHKVAVPKGGAVRTQKQAEEIFARIRKPVIVKPESGTRGRHSLTNLSTLDDLRHGFKVAQQLCCSVIVEEHLFGSVYRGTYVGGEVVGVLRGDPPRITGDGVSTIRQLIEKKNREKPQGVTDVVVRSAITEFLSRQSFTIKMVLPKGQTIDLIEKIGLSYGGDSAEEFHLVHPKLLLELKKAGDILNVPVIGFDFISEDITKDPDTIRWGIIEANSMPFIDLHHFPRIGTPINVAAKVWDLWGKEIPAAIA